MYGKASVFWAVLLACLIGVASSPQAGERLRMLCVTHPWTDFMKKVLPEFEKENNCTVQVEVYAEDQLTHKLTVEFAAGGAGVDVFMTRPLQDARMMKKNGWYVDLGPLARGDADYDFEDFNPGAVASTTVDGFLTAIPLITEMEVLYYRKDILKEKGIAVPTTLDELMAAAEKLTDRAGGFYGFACRGQRSPLVTQFSSFLYGFGGDFQNDAGDSLLNTPEFAAAVEYYGTILNKYAPEGILNMSWPQVIAVYNQGKLAFFSDASSLYSNVLDPAKSEYADRTGVAVFPKGPKAHKTYDITAWALSMYANSSNKDLAWKLISFLSDKKNTIYLQGDGMTQLARGSAWTDPAGTKNFPADWVEAVKASGPIGIGHDRPQVTAVSEARDIIGEAVAASIEGKDFRPALTEAHRKFQELIDREK